VASPTYKKYRKKKKRGGEKETMRVIKRTRQEKNNYSGGDILGDWKSFVNKLYKGGRKKCPWLGVVATDYRTV